MYLFFLNTFLKHKIVKYAFTIDLTNFVFYLYNLNMFLKYTHM